VANGECIEFAALGTCNNGNCPAAVTPYAYSNDTKFLTGPLASTGATVSGLVAVTDRAITGTNTATVDVIDNTTGLSVLFCTINTTTSFSVAACQNAGSVAVPAGHYLQVRITYSGAPQSQWRVTFRY
jgi:hypothetical protein